MTLKLSQFTNFKLLVRHCQEIFITCPISKFKIIVVQGNCMSQKGNPFAQMKKNLELFIDLFSHIDIQGWNWSSNLYVIYSMVSAVKIKFPALSIHFSAKPCQSDITVWGNMAKIKPWKDLLEEGGKTWDLANSFPSIKSKNNNVLNYQKKKNQNWMSLKPLM